VLQRQQHLNPGAAAIRLVPMSLGAVSGALLAGRLHGSRPHRVVLGWGLRTIACANATLVATLAASWLLPIGVALAGVGIGLASASATRIGTDVPPRRRDTAAGMLNTAAQLGSAIGTAALLCLSETTTGDSLPLSGPRLGWLAVAAAAQGPVSSQVRLLVSALADLADATASLREAQHRAHQAAAARRAAELMYRLNQRLGAGPVHLEHVTASPGRPPDVGLRVRRSSASRDGKTKRQKP